MNKNNQLVKYAQQKYSLYNKTESEHLLKSHNQRKVMTVKVTGK